jgi:hypothetical protein
VHVLDNSFLQPQPGTSAGDRLAGGLVPTAVLVAAAVCYPRLAGGWRRSGHCAAGIVGATVGIEAVYYLQAGIALFSDDAPPSSLKDLVAWMSPTPVFFIYGEHGQPGERNLNPTYYAAASPLKQIWEVPEVDTSAGSLPSPRNTSAAPSASSIALS